MIRSMTGFGRGESSRDGVHFTVELKTVNHRFLETSIRMSRKLAAFENDLRRLLSQFISRGKLDVYVTFEREQEQAQIQVHEEKLQAYLNVLRSAGERYSLPDDLRISHVLAFPEVLVEVAQEEESQEVWPVLQEAAELAVQQLQIMREREGAEIRQNLLEKADTLEEILKSLELAAPQVELEYKQKLEKRIGELTNMVHLDPGILETEVALFADKCCIDEELVRLKSHIAQLRMLLDSEEPVGRPLDFLLQEFNREANTIASKAGDLAVTQSSLILKKEIEKIREQIQNIE